MYDASRGLLREVVMKTGRIWSHCLGFSTFLLLTLAFQIGCDGECSTEEEYESNPACEDPNRGHITGQITIPGAAQSAWGEPMRLPDWLKEASDILRQDFKAVGALAPPEKRGKATIPQSDANRVRPEGSRAMNWREGEVIVRSETPMRDRRADFESYLDSFLGGQFDLEIGLCNTVTSCLLHIRDESGKPLGKESTGWVAERIGHASELRFSEVNLVLQMARLPNDDFYGLQWHYNAINMEGAWEITVGDPEVVAAIVDTGVLVSHPDLANRVVGSADLISDATIAQDGDARDDDGNDVGDNACGAGCHSFHGTHVAGTMGAESDNALMVSGMAWEGGLLAVRVLGQGGGSLFDIAGGILWSVGEEVEGVTRNDKPADVVNLSLGGQGESETMDETVQTAIDTGAIVVAAAGNENSDASASTPANSPGIITVAAVGNVGDGQAIPKRAPYSNFGNVVDLAGPGGDQSVDLDGDGQADGVLSTLDDFVAFYQGTSMAAPHVSGLAMLMKARNREMQQAEALKLMTDNANPDIECSEGCGSGMIDAARTLMAVEGREDEAMIVASPSMVRVGKGDLDARVVFENVGGDSATIEISIGGPNRDLVTADQSGGRVDAGASLEVNLDLARTGDDEGEVTLTAVWGEGQVTEARIVWNAEELVAADYVLVGDVWFDLETEEISVERAVGAFRKDDYVYKLFNLKPGSHIVIGLSDDDNDGELEENEGIGVYPSIQEPEFVLTTAGETVSDVNFIVSPAFALEENDGASNGTVGDACESTDDCQAAFYCEPALPQGYCTADCSSGPEACPEGSSCLSLCADDDCVDTYSICFATCETDTDCRDGYYCDTDNTCFPE